MTLKRRSALLAAVACGLTAACARHAPVYTVSEAAFAGDAPRSVRSEQIRRAGVGLGWMMEDVRPGLIRGTLNLRTHQAAVDIPYDRERFSIQYAGSTNLDHDGASIHSNYNGWVQRLEQTIVAQSSI